GGDRLGGGRRGDEGGRLRRLPRLVRPGVARLPRPRVRRAATRVPARERTHVGRTGDAVDERAADRGRHGRLRRAAPRGCARRRACRGIRGGWRRRRRPPPAPPGPHPPPPPRRPPRPRPPPPPPPHPGTRT